MATELPWLESKPWYTSRAVWGGIGAMLAGVGPLLGLQIDAGGFTETAIGIASLISGALAIWGRWKAERPVRFAKKQDEA
jgi:hypothetical protein